MRALWAAVLGGAAAAGCSSLEGAYQRDEALAVKDAGAFRFDDPSIEESFSKTGQVRYPAKLAVAGIEANRYGRFLDPEGADPVAEFAQDPVHWSDVVPLPRFLAGEAGGVEGFRKAAARVRADVVLLYEQSVELDRETSILSILNLLIVPAVLVPTVPYQASIRTTAAVIDVRNGFVYATAQDARQGDEMAPQAFVKEGARDLKRRLRQESFAAIRDAIRARLDRQP